MQRTLVMTEMRLPQSYDPLDADASNNMPLARMIYLTPLEVSSDDRLESTVLEKFSYDSVTKKAHWIVRKGLTFSDGTPITPDDVAFSVSRMAWKRPDFPVIKEISGVDQWSKSSEPLRSYPAGISVDGQSITITFTRIVDHPLFRFCLELFSIIPRRAVDLKSGQLIDKKPPTSGSYIVALSDTSSLSFTRRDQVSHLRREPFPESIRFVYDEPQKLLTSQIALDSETVVASNDFLFKPAELAQLRSIYELRDLPKARFSALLLNPLVQQFENVDCRRIFADYFRTSYGNLSGASEDLEGSISPRVVTGYVSLAQLKGHRSLGRVDLCYKSLAAQPIKWAVMGQGFNPAFQAAVKDTLHHFGQHDVEPIVVQSTEELDRLFTEGKVGLCFAGSGLWALDPFGDLQMLFTPGLHKRIEHLQQDQKLQAMINQLRGEMTPEARISMATDVNQHIFDDAVLNVFLHSRRFFLSKKGDIFRSLQASITAPTPWQVFTRP